MGTRRKSSLNFISSRDGLTGRHAAFPRTRQNRLLSSCRQSVGVSRALQVIGVSFDQSSATFLSGVVTAVLQVTHDLNFFFYKFPRTRWCGVHSGFGLETQVLSGNILECDGKPDERIILIAANKTKRPFFIFFSIPNR